MTFGGTSGGSLKTRHRYDDPVNPLFNNLVNSVSELSRAHAQCKTTRIIDCEAGALALNDSLRCRSANPISPVVEYFPYVVYDNFSPDRTGLNTEVDPNWVTVPDSILYPEEQVDWSEVEQRVSGLLLDCRGETIAVKYSPVEAATE